MLQLYCRINKRNILLMNVKVLSINTKEKKKNRKKEKKKR